MTNKLVIGTRGSKLALWQANYVAERIRQCRSDVEVIIKHIVTKGDKMLDVPLSKIDGKGFFTEELEKELLAGEIDLAVHSLKDMPVDLPEGLVLGAITIRLNPGDALISPKYKTLDNLPEGARVGTSSLRRKAQLLHCRPDLNIIDLRGNIDTRLSKLRTQQLDGIILAVAGLERLGWDSEITQVLSCDICIPAMGQGTLGVETRKNDKFVLSVLKHIHDEETAQAVAGERAYLRELEGGCQVPVGVHGRIFGQELLLEAVILSVDGTVRIKDSISGDPAEAENMGRMLAQKMYAAGGRAVLAELLGSTSGEEE